MSSSQYILTKYEERFVDVARIITRSNCLHNAVREAFRKFGKEYISLAYAYKIWVEKERGTLIEYLKELFRERLELTEDKIRLLERRKNALKLQLQSLNSFGVE